MKLNDLWVQNLVQCYDWPEYFAREATVKK
jgi:hypothetical protein